VKLREIAGEGDSERNRDIVLLAPAEPVHGVVVVDVPDEQVEVRIKESSNPEVIFFLTYYGCNKKDK